jgi:hypothetical protein
MLGILAHSLMTATRTENKIWVRDVDQSETNRCKNRHFWKGRKWRQIDPDKL